MMDAVAAGNVTIGIDLLAGLFIQAGRCADALVLGREDVGGKAELRGCLASVAARL